MFEVISRSEARSLGLKRYFTGRPCKYGHVVERLVSNGACVQCKRMRTKEWRQNNTEKEAQQNKRWRDRNREKCLAATARWRKNKETELASRQREYRTKNMEKEKARQAKWLAENASKMSAINARWYAGNRDKVAARDARRRARTFHATPTWESDLTDFAVQEAYDLACSREAITGFAWNVDHMIPLQARNACELHIWSNIQVIPAWLNLKKNNRLILTEVGEWLGHACALPAP